KDQFAQDYDPASFPLRYERVEYDWVAIDPWTNIQFASTLRRLREKKGYTQEDLANVTGITKSAIRSYEQRKRLPKTSQLEVLSLALDVTEGALTFFDFGSPVQAAHALFQIANTYALIPDTLESGEPVLRSVRPGLEQIIDQWADELSKIEAGTADLDYQEWKDVYDPEGDMDHGDFKHAYARRTRYETVVIDKGTTDGGGSLVETARCSKYDPYDCRYKSGFLRA
ncbi:MAG: helix-turn-helix transcriptional regulator, partial [Senegalimassilia sp.]|uniref:helix-turn-helix domain-containing protein n=1 Tax=Senegalimassilia sp. TaxID=1922200 RepID=UPI00284638F6